MRSGDEAPLDAFLRAHVDYSMFLRANLRHVGLVDRGAVYQGTYAAIRRAGDVIAVAAHYWNGILVVQAPDHLEAVVRAAVRASGRQVTGVSGPLEQVEAVIETLGLRERAAGRDPAERHYALDLDGLAIPGPLAAGAVVCRRPESAELGLLTEWRAAYEAEALYAVESPEETEPYRDDVRRAHDEQCHWLLEAEGRPVAYTRFNAALPDIVQVGGVWTPPELRGRGYARAVVAGSLLSARDRGVGRAILFTANPLAERAYQAIGFRVVGAYGLLLLATP